MPEEARATLYNLFRVPLNIIVVTVGIDELGCAMRFAVCVDTVSRYCQA